jgi:hypothetical protein
MNLNRGKRNEYRRDLCLNIIEHNNEAQLISALPSSCSESLFLGLKEFLNLVSRSPLDFLECITSLKDFAVSALYNPDDLI